MMFNLICSSLYRFEWAENHLIIVLHKLKNKNESVLMVGNAEPIIPVPEFKDGRVIRLNEIEEKGLLLLHTIRGNKAFTYVYDTEVFRQCRNGTEW